MANYLLVCTARKATIWFIVVTKGRSRPDGTFHFHYILAYFCLFVFLVKELKTFSDQPIIKQTFLYLFSFYFIYCFYSNFQNVKL